VCGKKSRSTLVMAKLRWWLCGILVGACGGSPAVPGAAVTDATVDGSPDAAVPDTNLGPPVTVEVPPGTTVLFYDPSNTLVARVIADQSGAKGYLPQGGAITMLGPAQPLRTIVGVEPGDVLVEIAPPQQHPPNAAGFITVSFPTDPGATIYDVRGTGFDAQVDNLQTLLDGDYVSPSDVLAWDKANGANAPFRFLVAHGQTLAPGGTVDLSADAWQAAIPFPLSISNAPSDVQGFGASIDYNAGRWTLLGSSPGATPGPVTGGAGTISLDSPGPVGDRLVTTIALSRWWLPPGPSSTATRSQMYVEHTAPTTTSVTLDLGTSGLPWLTGASFTPDDVVSWTTELGAAVPDAIEIDLLEGPFHPQASSWSVLAPGNLTTFTLPPLPADLASTWWSQDPSVARHVTSAALWKTSDPGGYRALRGRLDMFDEYSLPSPTYLLQSATGSIAWSTFVPQY
jgi:hypothetical protein